jgi:predicted nucleotidyltransferase
VSAIDASPEALTFVRETLARHVPEREVRVMGSRVTGRAKPFSDLDLVVMGDAPLDLAARGRLRDAFDDSSLPFRVDIIEWATASESFRRLIDAQALPLVSAAPAAVR